MRKHIANYKFDDDGNEVLPLPKSVSEVSRYIKELIEEEAMLQDVFLIGEVSNFKRNSSSGHYYFTLKDEFAQISAVMFRWNQRTKFMPENGMKVIVHGEIGVYEQYGSYQIYVDSVQPDGLGSLYLAYEQLKSRLDSEGLFDESHKKELPKFPNRIGVVTSDTGAAVRDIFKVAKRRYPCASIILFPSLVQGAEASKSLIAGIDYFNLISPVDVIIIGRGGGSIEDLWAFNDEDLARKIYASKIPVISAVGHETDFTICDFVADVRAATPSMAAELATPDISAVYERLIGFKNKAIYCISKKISSCRESLSNIEDSRVIKNPICLLDAHKERLRSKNKELCSAFEINISDIKLDFAKINSKLVSLNPMSVLSRGYGALFDKDGKVIKSVDVVSVDESIEIKISDGLLKAKVTEKEKK